MSSGTFPNAASQAHEVIVSPCIGVCTLGPGDVCIGCLRTSAEIGNWTLLTAQERNRVMAELPARLEALFAR